MHTQLSEQELRTIAIFPPFLYREQFCDAHGMFLFNKISRRGKQAHKKNSYWHILV